jgi:aminotransferase in exopolysaccharide biosynthesis
MLVNTDLIYQVVDAIGSVVGAVPVALHEPRFAGKEWEYVKLCLDSTFVSSVGKYVDRFEAELASYVGVKHVVAVVNGTAALHIALRLAGVEPGDEVLVPAMTFIATANAISYCNAVPHFVDSEEDTFGIDPQALRTYLQLQTEQNRGLCVNKSTGRIVRAMVPMHTFGHPGQLDELLAIAIDFNLVMVEDAAESLGSFYHGRHTGTFGLLGTLSFNGNKTITTGGGGAIMTNNTDLALRAKHITTTAKLPHAWQFVHDEVGYNYRLPNLNAALGCAQLEQLPQFIADKRSLFQQYDAAFAGVQGIRVKKEPSNCLSNYWLQTVVLDMDKAFLRDGLLKALNEAGFMSRPVWTLMHQLTPYRGCPRMDLKVAENLAKRLINIPSSAALGTGVSV